MPNLFAINTAPINGSADSPISARILVDAPLGSPRLSVFHDWTSLIPDYAVFNYLMDVVGTTTQRIPISSWQGTLQVDRSNFLQAVIPATGQYLDFLNAQVSPDFIIYRRATFDGEAFTQEMARSAVTAISVARGATNHTATLAGYESTFIPLAASALTTRTLKDIQTLTTYNGGIRARCAVDWFLRPGQNAIADGTEFTVNYINYIVNETSAYMDVGASQN
jgi:hypothetical protein